MTKLQIIKEQLELLESAIEMINESLTGNVNLDDLDLDAGYIKERALRLHDIIKDSLEEDEDSVSRKMRWVRD